jgi:hypothetical protein
MTYTLTDNPELCHRWHDWVAARTVLMAFLASHGKGVRPEGRFEPAENGRGYVGSTRGMAGPWRTGSAG